MICRHHGNGDCPNPSWCDCECDDCTRAWEEAGRPNPENPRPIDVKHYDINIKPRLTMTSPPRRDRERTIYQVINPPPPPPASVEEARWYLLAVLTIGPCPGRESEVFVDAFEKAIRTECETKHDELLQVANFEVEDFEK